MFWWILVLTLNVVLAGLAVLSARQANPRRRLATLAMCYGFPLVVSVILGIGWGLRASFVTQGEQIEPSQKARILAEGISESMNSAAFVVLSLSLPTLVALVLSRRSAKEGPRN
jgi:hypothetical protein